MNIPERCALAVITLLLGASPAFAQGVFQTPPSPNSAESMPQPPDSAPLGSRTLAPGSTATERMGGAIATTRVQPYAQAAARGQAHF